MPRVDSRAGDVVRAETAAPSATPATPPTPANGEAGVPAAARPTEAAPHEALAGTAPLAGPTRRQLFVRILLLLVVASTLLVALTVIRSDAFFRVEARTEIAQVLVRASRASELSNLHWELPGDDRMEVNGEITAYAGEIVQVVPGAGTRVVLRRAGTGPLIVEIHAATDSIAAVLRIADDPVAIARGIFAVQAQPSSDRTYTFPYFGAASIGDVVRSAGNELLLDGNVSVVGSTVLGDERFLAGMIPLRMGDDVRVAGPGSCEDNAPGVPGVGAVRADAGPGLAIVHEARGHALRISRAGTPTHCFRPSLWSFFSADPLLGGMLLFAAGVLVAVVQNLLTVALIDQHGMMPHRIGRGLARTRSGLPVSRVSRS